MMIVGNAGGGEFAPLEPMFEGGCCAGCGLGGYTIETGTGAPPMVIEVGALGGSA